MRAFFARHSRLLMAILSWAIVAGVAGFTAYVYFHNPFEGSVTFCTFHAVTGLDCPGCGMTRAAYLLMHGHPVQALKQNPFILIIPIIGYMGLAELSPHLIGRQLKKIYLPSWVLIALGILLAVYAVARNVVKFF